MVNRFARDFTRKHLFQHRLGSTINLILTLGLVGLAVEFLRVKEFKVSKKTERVGDINFGESRPAFTTDGALERGVTFQPTKPSNVTAPKNLPIPPAPPSKTEGNKK
jgi:hypothetical protein